MFHRFLTVAVATVAVTTAVAPTAVAQDNPAGPVCVKNATGADLTISGLKYVDARGNTQTLAGEWRLKAGDFGHLLHGPNKDKIVAKSYTFDLTTADGKSVGWACKSTALDSDGDFTVHLTADNLAAHRKVLGVAAPPAPAPLVRGQAPAADRQKLDADVTAAEREVRRHEGRLTEANNNLLKARGAWTVAKLAWQRTEQGSLAELLAEGAMLAAERVYDEVAADKESIGSDLKGARDRLNDLRRERSRLRD